MCTVDCIIFSMPKRGRRGSGEAEAESGDIERKRRCILHNVQVPQTSTFTFLSDVTDPAGRLGYIRNVKARRLREEPGSVNQQLHICQQIPDNDEELDEDCGYHRNCYSMFTSK